MTYETRKENMSCVKGVEEMSGTCKGTCEMEAENKQKGGRGKRRRGKESLKTINKN